jgi:hypothetical protein
VQAYAIGLLKQPDVVAPTDKRRRNGAASDAAAQRLHARCGCFLTCDVKKFFEMVGACTSDQNKKEIRSVGYLSDAPEVAANGQKMLSPYASAPLRSDAITCLIAHQKRHMQVLILNAPFFQFQKSSKRRAATSRKQRERAFVDRFELRQNIGDLWRALTRQPHPMLQKKSCKAAHGKFGQRR